MLMGRSVIRLQGGSIYLLVAREEITWTAVPPSGEFKNSNFSILIHSSFPVRPLSD